MSTTGSEATPRRRLTVGVVALLALSGCGGADPAPAAAPASVPPPTAAATSAAPAPAPVVVAPDPDLGDVVDAPDVTAAIDRALARRAEALLGGDEESFTARLATRDPAFLAQQAQYYANLRQLPLQTYTLGVDPATLVRDGAAYWANVSVSLQLQGYDALPVTTVDRYRFVPTAGGRRYRLASVTDAAWEERNGVRSEPWDVGPVEIRTGAGVLGVFDPASVGAAEPLLRSLEAGIADVSARVPYPWSRTVVVYALSDDSYLRSVPSLPGDDPDALDAVAVPVRARPDTTEVVATRLVLHPRMLQRRGPGRDRLLRHELTHAAIGPADDLVPVWLGEGLAEWVSVQAEAPTERGVPRPALRAAKQGFTDLPPDDGFNDDAAAEHYALSWWAVDYVASVAGPSAPWTVLDQMGSAALGAGSVDAATQDAVLTAVAGVNARTLARKAGKLLVATLDPPPPPPPAPTAPTAPPIELPTTPVVPPPV